MKGVDKINKVVHKNEIILYHSEIDNLDSYDIYILSAIKLILTNQYDCRTLYCPVNAKDVIKVLTNNNDFYTDKTKRRLNKSFKSLFDKNIVDYNKKIGSTYYINRYQLLFKEELFVSLRYEELTNTFFNELNSNIVKLYGCYIILLSTINTRTKFSYPSLEYLSEKFDMTIKTTQKYIKLLEKNKLIAIYQPQKTYDKGTGKFRSYNNVYFKPCDKEYVARNFGFGNL